MEPGEQEVLPLNAEGVFAPWELVGKSRRDSEPHRAGLLTVMAFGSVVAGGASFFCLVPALAGLSLGVVTWGMACRDLELMRSGAMDDAGFHRTEKARSNAHAGTVLSLLGLLLWAVLMASIAANFLVLLR